MRNGNGCLQAAKPILLVLSVLLVAALQPAAHADERVLKRSADKPKERSAPDAKPAGPGRVITKPAVKVQSRGAAQECTEEQTDQVEAARRAGAIRAQLATDRARGVRPTTGQQDRLEAQRAFEALVEADTDFDQVLEITEKIRDRVSSPSLRVVCASSADSNCSVRDAYVVGTEPPIHLCPTYFKTSSPEQRIRGLIHESAHLVGITQGDEPESYCPVFDCEITCGGFYAADAWSHFVHCVSGQPADKP
jgi:hypothetical protein